MSISLLLAVSLFHRTAARTPVGGGQLWEEYVYVQQTLEYHPSIRFNPESTYMFRTPDLIQQGKFSVDNGHYTFRAIMAMELENSDIAKLAPEMNPEAGQKFAEAYARSMSNFQGDYDEASRTLTISYPVMGGLRTYHLHAYTEGDDQLTSALGDGDRGIAGVWHAPDPFPERLDARTRNKIGGIEGLQQFAGEAMKSDAAQFGLLDLRIDKSFRLHGDVGTWQRDGSILHIRGKSRADLTLSADGNKLMAGGKAVFVRN